MLSVSTDFTDAEEADVNAPKASAQLVLGNYCVKNLPISSIDVYSADWPVTGATDGDRTELNAGAASGAYNSVGHSVWRSFNQPDSSNGFLNILFDQNRVINRLKIYHYANHGLKNYAVYTIEGTPTSYSIGVTQLIRTVGFGVGSGVQFTSNGEFDVIDFPDKTCVGLRVQINGTQVAMDNAYIVEIESYRVVDITDRIKMIDVQKGRDYKLANPIATQATIECDNTDRFFSFDYFPTVDEIAEGFVNQELAPNVGIVIQYGFDTEYVVYFTGTIDRITVNPAMRSATIAGRDFTKQLLNQTVSCKLVLNTDIADLVEYVLNVCNFSSWEIETDATGVDIDYFFTNRENAIDTIRKLVEAAGDASFFFDEEGVANFKN